MSEAKRIRVITVHGTFDPGALWDNPDSTFVHGLSERLGAAGCALDLYNYEWSGENSHEARREAAEGLADRVEEDLESREFREVFVIGHSHGGTIARLAMNLMQGDRRPSGVFTFGSPFVRFRPRPVRGTMRALQWFSVALGVLVAILLGFAIKDAFADELRFDLSLLTGPIALGLGLLAVIALTVAANRLLRRARIYLTEKRAYLTQRFDPPERLPVGFLCYHAIGDEAGLLLRFWSFVTWLMQTMIYTLVYGALTMIAIMVGVVALRILSEAGIPVWQMILDGPDRLRHRRAAVARLPDAGGRPNQP